MRQTLSRGMVAAAAATGILSLCAGGNALADSTAQGAAKGSPGVLSGNSVQAPLHVPVNACGNSVDVIAALNPVFGNSCANLSDAHGHRSHGTPPGDGESRDGDSGYGDSGHDESGYGDSGHGESGYGDSGHDESGYGDSGHGDSGHGDSGYGESGHGGAGHEGHGPGDDCGGYGDTCGGGGHTTPPPGGGHTTPP
ncbi:chaplin, partial [Streptomyces coriariae]|uniref:chaplin n=1 Tax=Streptomyces coriariae TaxID=2864460 RepID=UPI002342BF67